MISRVADHCFWFGRYLERAESTARILQVTSGLALDSDLTPLQIWQPVIITAGEEERFVKLHGAEAVADGEAVQEHLVFHDEVPVCLRRSVAAARENARSVREVVSLEAWESINELHLWMRSAAAREEYENHRDAFYRHVRRETQLCLGLLRGTMLHDFPLEFIWLGVVLERTGQTARMLDVHYHALTIAVAPAFQSQSQGTGQQQSQSSGTAQLQALPLVEVALWLSLLRACYGFEPFMKSHHGTVTGEAVASFLIFEPRFPRAVRHCVKRAREGLEKIRPAALALPTLRAAERVRALESWLDSRAGQRLDPATIHEILTRIVDATHAICDEIAVELLGATRPDAEETGGSNPGVPGKGPE